MEARSSRRGAGGWGTLIVSQLHSPITEVSTKKAVITTNTPKDNQLVGALTDHEVEQEEGAHHHEHHKEEAHGGPRVGQGLVVQLRGVGGLVHDVGPGLQGGHLMHERVCISMVVRVLACAGLATRLGPHSEV